MQEHASTTSQGRGWRISGMEARRAPRTRCEAPDAALAHLLTRYELWTPPACERDDEPARALWVLPGEARLVVSEAPGQLSALIGNRRYDALPQVTLFGPTSRATRLVGNGGPVLGIGLSALGWAAIVGRSAAALGDRVVAATDVFEARLVAGLAGTMAQGAPQDLARRIDAVLGATALSRCPDEPLVLGLTAIIEEGSVCAAEVAGEQLGVAAHVVRRSALRHFGYPPKVLLNRKRFKRALERMIVAERGYSEAANHGYFDASHFIRDSRRFLGMTPRRFLALAA